MYYVDSQKLSHGLAVSVEATVGRTIYQFDSFETRLRDGMYAGLHYSADWRLGPLAVRLRCTMRIAKAHRCGGEGDPLIA